MTQQPQQNIPSWHQAIRTPGYDAQFAAFSAYFDDYSRWFAIKSNFSLYIMKLGLYLLLFAIFLFTLNGGGWRMLPASAKDSPVYMVALMIVAALFFLFVLLGDKDGRDARWRHNPFHVKLINTVMVVALSFPLCFHLLGSSWQMAIGPLVSLGAGVSLAAFMINRLDGYTRAWSRYRTALFKIQLNDAEKQANHINESQAQRRLLLIVNDEIEDRHKDIIKDLNFFGDRFTSLLRKK
ncbi:MAG: hypothetical protein ACI8WB_000929 [Phenylobacterium sp.]|jgi:hypothetical protein